MRSGAAIVLGHDRDASAQQGSYTIWNVSIISVACNFVDSHYYRQNTDCLENVQGTYLSGMIIQIVFVKPHKHIYPLCTMTTTSKSIDSTDGKSEISFAKKGMHPLHQGARLWYGTVCTFYSLQ